MGQGGRVVLDPPRRAPPPETLRPEWRTATAAVCKKQEGSMGRSIGFFAVALAWMAMPARAQQIATCPDVSTDPAAQLTQEIDQLGQTAVRFNDQARAVGGNGYSGDPTFVQNGSDAAPASTVWDKKAVMDGTTGDGTGRAPTVAWTDDEKKQFQSVESKLLTCVRQKSGVQDAYCIQRN